MPKQTRIPKSASATFAKVKKLLNIRHVIPDDVAFKGSGGPGTLLEHLLGVDQNNKDSPDLDDWELKFHGGTALLTLFHKDPQPKGIVRLLVHEHGWENDRQQISFRHTISGRSSRGFQVVNELDRVVLRHDTIDTVVPYWTQDVLMNAIGAKLRRLILVKGKVLKNPRSVIFESATAFWDFKITDFCSSLEKGYVCIDFDARTKGGPGTALRNHGTKFRVKVDNISKFYHEKTKLT